MAKKVRFAAMLVVIQGRLYRNVRAWRDVEDALQPQTETDRKTPDERLDGGGVGGGETKRKRASNGIEEPRQKILTTTMASLARE